MSENLNIWIVSEGEPLPTDKGEARLRRMGLLSKILVERDNEVTWFSSSFHHYKKEQRIIYNETPFSKDKFKVSLLRSKGYKKNISFKRISHHKTIAKAFKKRAADMPKPDIILATMAPIEFSSAAVKYANSNKIPILIDIRDLWPEIYKEMLPFPLSYLSFPYIYLTKIKLKKTLNNADGILGVTDKFLEYGKSMVVSEKHEKVFHTSYPPNKQSISDNIEWINNFIVKEDFVITFMGNFGKQFNLKPLINVARKLKDYRNIKFILCGTGSDLEKIKVENSDLKNVIFPGWIDSETIATVLNQSSVGIAPYRDSINFRDNIPNKFGEYLSYSLPILVGVEGEMKNLLEESESGFYYKDENELKKYINKMFKDKNLVKSMSENAFELYEGSFNSEVVYKDFANYLEEIVELDVRSNE